MKRRKFLGAVAATSAGVLASSALAAEKKTKGAEVKYGIKITVLRKTLHQDFIDKYRHKPAGICSRFEEGQEFILKGPWNAPEGFCDWAWADIRTFIGLVHAGKYEQFVACCTDGYRPVYFKIERIIREAA